MKRKIFIIIGIFAVIAISLGLTKFIIESGVDELEQVKTGEIPLPNNYAVIKIHAQKGNIITSKLAGTMVEPNVFEVGDNGKIIAYKKEAGSKIEYGFIDTSVAPHDTAVPEKIKSNMTVVTESEFNEKIKQLNISVIPVEKLFTETKEEATLQKGHLF